MDANQREIISALRGIGATVQLLHQVGGGCPDLLVGFGGQTVLLEVKNPEGRDRLQPEQEAWHNVWKGGPLGVVRSVEEAESAVRGAIDSG